ncbi:MAG: DUF3048 domain-containing protein [Parcubacteria group bacterium]|nr:DUF3048 domain-containing protein [Parcubacteria group bacterium]
MKTTFKILNKFYIFLQDVWRKKWGKQYFFGTLILIIILLTFKFNSRVFEIYGVKKNLVTQYSCSASQRPVAVMLASDPVARPLSGLSQADLVFEMPVNQDGVTRIMAVFRCVIPDEIGSVRSARKAFIDLVGAIDSIYVHWGGEGGALEQLNKGVLDNIDALKYEESYFFRKSDIPKPHNGFTNPKLLAQAIDGLKYDNQISLDDTASSFFREKVEPFISPTVSNDFSSNINIDYAGPFKVFWSYDSATRVYRRFRGSTPEIDKNNNKQVEFDNIVVMKTTWSPINIDYIDVNITGEGVATFYKNGQSFPGKWVKKAGDIKSPLELLTLDNIPFEFNPGKIWIEIIF